MCHRTRERDRQQRRGSHNSFDKQLVSVVDEAESVSLLLYSHVVMQSSGTTRNWTMEFLVGYDTDDSTVSRTEETFPKDSGSPS